MLGSGADGIIVLDRTSQSAGEFINLDVICPIGMCAFLLCTGCPFIVRTLRVLHFLLKKVKYTMSKCLGMFLQFVKQFS